MYSLNDKLFDVFETDLIEEIDLIAFHNLFYVFFFYVTFTMN